MTVNSYLVWSPHTKVAVAFDTGANVDALLADVKALGLELQALVLTHAHRDHIAAYDELLSTSKGALPLRRSSSLTVRPTCLSMVIGWSLTASKCRHGRPMGIRPVV